MDLKTPNYTQNSPVFRPAKMESSPLEEDQRSLTKENPFADAFTDPLCKLNLKETSEFVRSFPMGSKTRTLVQTSALRRSEGVTSVVGQRRLDAPSTPGRPAFGFNGVGGRKSIPSKWDDAEKWIISTSYHESPSHVSKETDTVKVHKQSDVFFKTTTHEISSDVFLKDKFTEKAEPIIPCFEYTESAEESFLFSNALCETMKDASTEVLANSHVHHRDGVTQVTPFGSLTTSRCNTPMKTSSPARHNTPADRSGVLLPPKPNIDLSELNGCHFAKLDLRAQFDSVGCNWTSKEEEEDEVSKSLRHFEVDGGRKSIAESKASAWEDEEKSKSCMRYQREEAKIQALLNLQCARAEAQSRKLEVKIQKMISNLEEKVMKRMASVQRRAEQWRAAAQLQHSQEIRRVEEQAEKMKNMQHPLPFHLYENTKCGCLPCTAAASAVSNKN